MTTKTTIALADLVEKGGDSDLLRDMIQYVAQRLMELDTEGLCAAAGSLCASGATEPSYVLTAMGLSLPEAAASVRLSLGFSSTDADVDRALEVIPRAVARLRGAAVPA